MKPIAPITSQFAVLSIRQGRKRVATHLAKAPRSKRNPLVIEKASRIPVIIKGYIDDVSGNDDGIDQEFALTVISVQIMKEPKV